MFAVDCSFKIIGTITLTLIVFNISIIILIILEIDKLNYHKYYFNNLGMLFMIEKAV